MSTFHRTTVLALFSSLVVASVSVSAVASQPQAVLIAPGGEDCYIPKFGFSSFNIGGYGERVTFVQWGGLAAQFGLEPGDTILSVNGFRLTYHGSWHDALHQAMSNGGFVRLKIRDVRTGAVVSRQMNLGGGVGPITPKYYAENYGPNVQHVIHHDHDHHNGHGPVGPVTPKSKFGPQKNQNVGKTIKEIAKLFND